MRSPFSRLIGPVAINTALPSDHSQWVAAMPALFVILWSTGFIGAKFGIPHAEPMTFLGVRFAAVVVLLLLLSLAMRAPWPATPGFALHIAVSGLLVQATYLGGVFSAIQTGIPAGIIALITGLQPVLTAVLAGPFLGEKISRRQWIGFALGSIGVVLVVGNKLGFSGDVLPGILLAFIGLAGITAGTIYQKKFCTEMDLRTGSLIQFAASAVVIWLLALLFEERLINWTGEFIFALGWLVIVLSIGAISLLLALIRRGVASKVASLFYLVPPVTALMAFFAFGETLGPLALAGMALAVTGVALITREN